MIRKQPNQPPNQACGKCINCRSEHGYSPCIELSLKLPPTPPRKLTMCGGSPELTSRTLNNMSIEKLHEMFAYWYASEHDDKRPNRHGLGYCTPEEEDLWWGFRSGAWAILDKLNQ